MKVDVTVRFGGTGEECHPVAVALKRPRSGSRVTVSAEAGVATASHIYLLCRAGADIVLMGSIHQEVAEAAHRAMGVSAGDYRVIKVAVLKDAHG